MATIFPPKLDYTITLSLRYSVNSHFICFPYSNTTENGASFDLLHYRALCLWHGCDCQLLQPMGTVNFWLAQTKQQLFPAIS